MNSLAILAVAFGCVFCGALLGEGLIQISKAPLRAAFA